MSDQKLNSALMSMSTEEMRNLLECPVCRQTFRNPKSLPCGHSVCAQCCRSLNRERVNLCCPVCRFVSTISSEKLPINFGLRDLVQHHMVSVDAKKFSCLRCTKKVSEDESWLCADCRTIVCCSCALRSHQSHKLEEIKELVVEKETQVNERRSMIFSKLNETEKIRNQIDFNRLKLAKFGNQIMTTLRTKLLPEMESGSKDLKREQTNLATRAEEMSAFQIISDEITATGESDFDSLPRALESLKEKQELIVKKQNDTFEALRKCNETLSGMVSAAAQRLLVPTPAPIGQRMTARMSVRQYVPAAAAEAISDDGGGDLSEEFDGGADDDESGEETNSEISVVSRPTERTPTQNTFAANHFSTLIVSRRGATPPYANSEADGNTNRSSVLDLDSPRNRRNVAMVRHRVASSNNNNRVQFQVNSSAANRETVVVVDDDDDDNSQDDMDVGPGTSSTVSSSAATDRSTPRNGNRPTGAQKRSRRSMVREESSSDSDDGDEEARDNAIDSTIHFRILRKFHERNN